MKSVGQVKVSENKFTKSAVNMRFNVAERFLFNFSAASENFGLRNVKNTLKEALKRSNLKVARKRSQKPQKTSHFIGKTVNFLV